MTSASLWTGLLVGLATGIVTLVGGTLVLRFRSAFDRFLAFSAGAVIGVALFDLLPEALELVQARRSHLAIATAVAVGYLLYLALDRASTLLAAGPDRGRQLAPATFTLHSLLDGLAIGLAFHLSSTAGAVVTMAVLGHDLVDGANIVAVTLAHGFSATTARAWLAADAIAPLTGILITSAIAIPVPVLAPALGVFAGFFLYIGTIELLPRSFARPRLSTLVATGAGMAFIYAVIWLANFRGPSSG
jgi:ZIP family zinc transporter